MNMEFGEIFTWTASILLAVIMLGSLGALWYDSVKEDKKWDERYKKKGQ